MQLQVLTVLAYANIPSDLCELVFKGHLQEAITRLESALRTSAGAAQPVAGFDERAQFCGDLMLALDRAEEAEEVYRRAVRDACHGERGAVRVASRRATAFMQLHRQRFGPAMSCFTRQAEDEAATPAQRVEALCGLAVAREGLGQQHGAAAALEEAARLCTDAGDARLSLLVRLMRVELGYRAELQRHDLFDDHVFWHTSLGERPATPGGLELCAMIDALLAEHADKPLVAIRLRHLRALLAAARGQRQEQRASLEYLAWLRVAGLMPLEVQARLDIALVGLAEHAVDFARGVLQPLHAWDLASRRRWSIEFAYCQAKLGLLVGRADEAMHHYRRYARESMQCLRSALPGTDTGAGASVREPMRDDIEMRLPAKYRRAYRYLQEHLDCPELSVREIAENMGVTERALQAAFKSHLGMSPGEVIQRCRVERIRAEFLREDGGRVGVTKTAARWGIRNRSTLITSYRKYFCETPTQTLARRDMAVERIGA